MRKHYNHLTHDQRSQISVLKSIGRSNKEIASAIKVDKTTIGRELKRNSKPDEKYDHHFAQSCAVKRKSSAHCVAHKMTPELIAIINPLIKEDWSPEQISGWLLKKYGISISHERIYQYIWANKRAGGTLFKHLRHKGKKYNYSRNTNAAGRGHIANRIDIKERPAVVEEKKRLGDLEIDLIIGAKHQGAVLTVVDRMSKLTRFATLINKTPRHVTKAILRVLGTFKFPIFTITVDNGKEFCWHEFITKVTGIPIYFATPYHSWERGLVEHTNGLARQYLPKKSNLLTSITDDKLKIIENKLNNRPRKVLHYLTPKEMAQDSLGVALNG